MSMPTATCCRPSRGTRKRRLRLRAKLDAVFFHLYGVTDRDDVRYVYSTFPIVEREETAAYGTYRSRDLCLAWMNALTAPAILTRRSFHRSHGVAAGGARPGVRARR